MQAPEPCELSVFEARDGAEDAHLLAVLQLGLEPHHVEQRGKLVVLAQLHHRIGLVGVGMFPANRVGVAFLNNSHVSAARLVYRLPHLVLDGLFPQVV